MSQPKNAHRITLITAYLLANASETNGVTAQEICEAIPDISKSAIHRILREHPAIKQTRQVVYPSKYYFDTAEAAIIKKAPVGKTSTSTQAVDNSYRIRPELVIEPAKATDAIKAVVQRIKPDSDVYQKGLYPLGISAQNALRFQAQLEELDLEHWPLAQEGLEKTLKWLASIYISLDAIRNDPRYNSPEWWAIFEGDK